jgi:succinate dehydrogenase / fumarate reductase cytochrome b subunit
MSLLKSSVGRKILMAITGQLMVLFVVVHLLGNSSIFIGPNGINSYAEHLHSLGPLVWIFRLAMLTFLLVHGIFGIQVSIENSSANPAKYAINKKLKRGFASENMIWTGVLLFLFIVYHITHFTARLWSDVSAFAGQVPGNVFGMVTGSFSHGIIAFTYVAAMVVLCLHLFHGIQSFFQTMGWNNAKSLPVISQVGRALAVIFLVGYSSIPVFILAGIIR